ncbi:MAG: hypothetical protein A4E65_03618 [Syntrophorhabdus sp. PtaU1.Bin153]|nr:MAG: hypothetical protein A4E65_03618 [Syntrophorhabdus sp. PtaU1.Bin153]
MEAIDYMAEFEKQVREADGQTLQTVTPGTSEPISTDAPLTSEDVLDDLRRNEDGDAKLFQELHRGRFCYDGSSGRWYSWKTHSWEKDVLGEVTRAIDAVINAYAEETSRQTWQRLQAEKAGRTQEANQRAKTIDVLYKRIRTLQTVARKENVLTLARTGADSLAIRGDEWDRDPWLLACPNGIIDLRTGNLRPGTPNDYIKTVAPVEYHGKNTPAPHFDRFISEVFNHDQELIGFIQRLLGYMITGDISEHILAAFEGKGRNGKSTLVEIISFILGGYAGQIESEMLLAQKFGRQSGGPSPDIMALRGKRFVHCSETESGRHFNLSKVKWLSGGDTLTGRELYGKELVTFRPTHKIVLSTNHRPHANADDYAFWKRALLIPFNLSFVADPKESHERKADPQLPEKLRAEAPGILSWLVRGCLEWQKQRLNPPDCVKAATEEYRNDEDIIKHFIDDRCLVAPELSVKALVLYKAYRLWCEEMGHVPLNGTNFAIKIKAKFGSKRTMHGFVYFGFDLLAGA